MEGLVIAHLGQGIAVEHDNRIILCQPLRKLETVAVGDRVQWTESGPDQGRIEAILERKSLLARPARYGKIRPVAANIDQVFIVVAAEPACDFLLLDQYLAVCENSRISAAIVLNKIDLTLPEALEEELAVYEGLGYPIHRVCALKALDLDQLRAVLNHQVTILTGQSGVGKSSLTNALIPDKELKTKGICQSSKLGRHTTTAATLYHLPDGGDLIDSPGLSIFGLADMSEAELAYGYREFQSYLGHCKFNDCDHRQDKGCNIREAVENGKISMDRFQRFLKLKEKMAMKKA